MCSVCGLTDRVFEVGVEVMEQVPAAKERELVTSYS